MLSLTLFLSGYRTESLTNDYQQAFHTELKNIHPDLSTLAIKVVRIFYFSLCESDNLLTTHATHYLTTALILAD